LVELPETCAARPGRLDLGFRHPGLARDRYMVVSLVDIAAEREGSKAQNLTISRRQIGASNHLVEKRQENTVHPRVLHEDAREVEVMPFADQRLLLGGEIAERKRGDTN
jgi:hypothetical protein